MYTFQVYQIVWFINHQQIHEWPSAKKSKQTNLEWLQKKCHTDESSSSTN